MSRLWCFQDWSKTPEARCSVDGIGREGLGEDPVIGSQIETRSDLRRPDRGVVTCVLTLWIPGVS